jgi:hypothetical protein
MPARLSLQDSPGENFIQAFNLLTVSRARFKQPVKARANGPGPMPDLLMRAASSIMGLSSRTIRPATAPPLLDL